VCEERQVGQLPSEETVCGDRSSPPDHTSPCYYQSNRRIRQPSTSSAELDGFVDALARRIASFDRDAIAAAKNLINQVSLPTADHLLDAFNSFTTALAWPAAQGRIQALLKCGLQRDSDYEKRWPEMLGTLLEM